MVADTFKLLLAHLRANLMSQLEYRGATIIQVIGMVIENALLLFFWYLFFSIYPSLNGWVAQDVMLLFAVVTGGFGLATLVCGNTFRVASLIINGELDYYLVLPTPTLVHMLISSSSMSAWGDISFSVLVFLIAGPLELSGIAFYLVSLTVSALIFVSFAVIVGSLAFFLGQAETLAMQGLGALLGFGMYPIDIFPVAGKVILLTLIPAGLIGSVPAQAINGPDLGVLGLIIIAAAIFVITASFVFRLGLRRYESGNRINSRM